MKSIVIIGASKDRNKFGNKAVRAYKEQGFKVFPINPKEKEIEGLKCFKSVSDVPAQIDLASLYLPPKIGINVIKEVAKKGIKEIYLNPGTESDELIKKCKELNVKPLIQCSILAVGRNPGEFN